MTSQLLKLGTDFNSVVLKISFDQQYQEPYFYPKSYEQVSLKNGCQFIKSKAPPTNGRAEN